eukprot:2526840-Amphidinium_carterae.1
MMKRGESKTPRMSIPKGSYVPERQSGVHKTLPPLTHAPNKLEVDDLSSGKGKGSRTWSTSVSMSRESRTKEQGSKR